MTRDPFADDVLKRLVASNQDYQHEHGHYIVPLAQRLLDTRAELERAERERDDFQGRVSAMHTAVRGSSLHAENAYQERDRIKKWYSDLYDAVTAQIEHELDGLGYDGNADGCEALKNIRCALDDVNQERHSAALAAAPIGLGHLPHEDVPEGVVAHREPGPGTVGHYVIGSRLDDLPDTLKVWAIEPPDGDLYPVANVELHHPKVIRAGDISYANVRCGLCEQTTGCECAS